jgi:hypothetical protein
MRKGLWLGPVKLIEKKNNLPRMGDIIVGELLSADTEIGGQNNRNKKQLVRTQRQIYSWWHGDARCLWELAKVTVNGTTKTEEELRPFLTTPDGYDDVWALARLILFGNVQCFVDLQNAPISNRMRLHSNPVMFIHNAASAFNDPSIMETFQSCLPQVTLPSAISKITNETANDNFNELSNESNDNFNDVNKEETFKFYEEEELFKDEESENLFKPVSFQYLPTSPTYNPRSPTPTPMLSSISSPFLPKSPKIAPVSAAYLPTSPTYNPRSPTPMLSSVSSRFSSKSPKIASVSPAYLPTSPTYNPGSEGSEGSEGFEGSKFVPVSPCYFPTSPTYNSRSPISMSRKK